MLMYFDNGMYLRSYMFCSAATVEILYIYACCMFGVDRRSVYFLNICYIRVFYRFNRNRALQHAPSVRGPEATVTWTLKRAVVA
jgi:hypothetical protein